MNHHRMITEILRDIPWLPIDIDIDINRLQKEYKFICENYEFKPYYSDGEIVSEKYAKAWSGISLISSDSSLYNDLRKGQGMGDNYLPTELEEYCKYSFQLIDLFSARKSKCRVFRISPQSSLAWHSHFFEHNQPEHILTIQIPIEIPDDFEYCVVDKEEFTIASNANYDKWVPEERFAPPSRFKNIHRGKLDVGKAYYFNSYHFHNVFNYSDTYRASLVWYCSLKNENFKQLIEKSLIKEGLWND